MHWGLKTLRATIRVIAGLLLVVTALFHLGVGFFEPGAPYPVPIAIFGILYVALAGLLIATNRRQIILAAGALPLAGLAVGALICFVLCGSMMMPVLLATEAAVLPFALILILWRTDRRGA